MDELRMRSVDCKKIEILKKCLFWTFILGLAAHAFSYFNLHFNHDSVEIMSPFWYAGSWHVSLGRFFIPVVSYARGILNSPWLIGLLSLIFIGFSVYLIAIMFQITDNVCLALISGIFVTNASVTVQNATFMFSMDAVALAFLLSILSVYLIVFRKNVLYVVFAVISLTAAIATTGSYISVWVALVIVALLFRMLKFSQKDSDKELFREVLVFAIVAVSASILFVISVNVASRITKVSILKDNYNSFNQAFQWNSVSEFLIMIIKSYKNFLLRFFIQIPFYDIRVRFLFDFFIIAIFVFSIVVSCIKLFKKNLLQIVFGLSLGAVLPFVAELSFFLTHGGVSYEGTMWPHYIIYIYPILFFHDYTKKIMRLIQSGFFLFVFSNVIIANGIHVKTKMFYDSTCSTLNRIIAQMEQCDGYVTGDTPVVFVGLLSDNKNFQKRIFPKYGISTDKGSSVSVTYINTYVPFIQTVMNNDINCNVYSKEYSDFPKVHSADVNAMPIFPSKGFCKMLDGTMVVKLSDLNFIQKNSILPGYVVVNSEVNSCIDNEVCSDNETYIRGWAYHGNDICRVLVVYGDQYWNSSLELRPDVQKTYGLNNDKQGYEAVIPMKVTTYSLYLVNDQKKEVYKIK